MSCKSEGNCSLTGPDKIENRYNPLKRTAWIVVVISVIGWGFFASVIHSQETETTAEEGNTVYQVHIHKGGDKFEPSLLHIKVGDTVTWINDDDRGHPVASIPGQGTNDKELFSEPIAPGKSMSHTFKKAGEYPYFCYIHYVMMGAIIVEGEQGPAE